MRGLNMNRSGASAELTMESTIRMMERYLGLIQHSGDFPPRWTSCGGMFLHPQKQVHLGMTLNRGVWYVPPRAIRSQMGSHHISCGSEHIHVYSSFSNTKCVTCELLKLPGHYKEWQLQMIKKNTCQTGFNLHPFPRYAGMWIIFWWDSQL